MAEIDMTAPTVALEVGAYGVQRNGRSVGPFEFKDRKAPRSSYFSAPCGEIWMCDGSWTSIPNGKDIIRIISAPDSVEPDATQKAGVVVDIVCETVRVLHRGGVVFVEIAKDLDGGDAGIATVHDGTSVVKMTPAAAIAIARAILRMAGESK
jgi:hypothetical protein